MQFQVFGFSCLIGYVWPGPDWNIDAPSYDFKKLNPSKEEDHQIVNKYLLWEGDFGGKVIITYPSNKNNKKLRHRAN